MFFSSAGDRIILEEFGGLFSDHPQIKEEIRKALESKDEAQIAIVASKVRVMYGVLQSEHCSQEAEGERQIQTIPTEHRSKPITKTRAAKLLGKPNADSGVEWLNNCIEDGTITCETLSRQSHVFDIRAFPDSVQGQLQVK